MRTAARLDWQTVLGGLGCLVAEGLEHVDQAVAHFTAWEDLVDQAAVEQEFRSLKALGEGLAAWCP